MNMTMKFQDAALPVVLAAGIFCGVPSVPGCLLPPPPPLVTVTATDANAAEVGPNTGTFTVARTGSTASALTVYYTLGGTAGNGTDYQTLSGWVQIQPGQTTANVTVTPMTESDCEGSETVVLTLVPYAFYEVGSASSGTVTIADTPDPTCDSDADGLPDSWESNYLTTLAYGRNDDPDVDGLTNFEEYVLGTNPAAYTSLNGLISGSGLLVFTPLQ